MKFKHKYITNPSITTGDAIVNAAQQLNSALSGSILSLLFKSGIDHLRALTDILNATKEGYNDREEKNPTKTTARSPRVPMGSPPPRVAKDKNRPDLVPTDTSNDNNEGDTQDKDISPPACNTRSQTTSFSIMGEIMLSCCQMSRTSY